MGPFSAMDLTFSSVSTAARQHVVKIMPMFIVKKEQDALSPLVELSDVFS